MKIMQLNGELIFCVNDEKLKNTINDFNNKATLQYLVEEIKSILQENFYHKSC